MEKKQTLLEKAKAYPKYTGKKRHAYSEEEIELVFAWIKGEVTNTQFTVAKGYARENISSLYSRISVVIRQAYQEGKIIIKDK